MQVEIVRDSGKWIRVDVGYVARTKIIANVKPAVLCGAIMGCM
jgi:hypothetical protein